MLDRPLVLVVDDDHELCTNLEDLLRERGFRVALAHDAEEVAGTLGERAYSVVLIDMKLPGGDGLSVFRQVRQANPEARTVVISGYRSEMENLIERALQEGADAVCYKPFDMPRLLEILNALARRKTAPPEAFATGVKPSSC
jgi:DNA-binding response OmpR family regulator